MRAVVVAGMVLAAGTVAAADFGVQMNVAEEAVLRGARPPLKRVECNTQRCAFQNPTKDITALIRFDEQRTVTGFYIFYRPTNWAIAADYAAQIQSALKVPAGETVDVRAVAEAGKDGKHASANSRTVSCRSEGGSTPAVICERS